MDIILRSNAEETPMNIGLLVATAVAAATVVLPTPPLPVNKRMRIGGRGYRPAAEINRVFDQPPLAVGKSG